MNQRLISLLFFLFSITLTFAQTPLNDDCLGIIQLGVAPMGTCTTTEYTTVNATPSTISSIPTENIPSCWSSVDHDVWFEFQTPTDGSIVDFQISISGVGSTPIGQIKAAIYRGACGVDQLAELACGTSGVGATEFIFDQVVTTGLTPGISYFIRVDDQSATAAPAWGTFNVCVDLIPEINSICDGGSTSNSGIVFDTGGPNDNYENDESCNFTICPTSDPACIFLTVKNYDIEDGFDFLEFHDGPNASSPTIGDQVDAGGSCYTVQATSGCLTIEWNSDYIINNPGFEIEWESSSVPCPTFALPDITQAPSEAVLLEKLNASSNAISNVTVNCNNNAIAAFDGTDNTLLFMEKGVALTTGSISYAFTANDSDGDPTTSNNTNTDPDLEAMANDISFFAPTIRDACVLEMDIVAAAEQISLEYIFGSDEYLGNSDFGLPEVSDVMGIWISGPGIAGDPLYNNQELISTIPGTNNLVHLSTINNQTNFEYFRFNEETDLGPRYDGLTTDFNSINKKTLTASAQVQQCSTYHLKIAIADNNVFGDFGDSGLFINDLDVGSINTTILGTTGFNNLVEGCTDSDVLNLDLSNPLGEDFTLEVQVAGTATQGVDYNLTIPNNITFTSGQTNLSFPITINDDSEIEGTETIELNFIYDYGCGSTPLETVIIEINDAPELVINNGMDTVLVCTGSTVQLNASGLQTYSWMPDLNINSTNIPNPTITPTVSALYTVEGTLGSCMLTEEIFVQVIDPQVSIVALGDTEICVGESVQLTTNNNVNNSGLTWSPSFGLDDPTIANPTVTPSQSITYTATVSISGCEATDQIAISVDQFYFPTFATMDTTICIGDSIHLEGVSMGGSTGITSTTYTWTPAQGLSNPNIPDPIAMPTSNTSYTLTATSANGFCSEIATVNIDVVPATLEIQGASSYELCLGETVELTAMTSTGGTGFSWSPDSSLTSGTATTVIASPEVSTNYIAQLEVDGCILQETVTVSVDSLPNTLIEAIPQKDLYCKDEIISLISPSIDLGFFPNIDFMWSPNNSSLLSDPNNLNLVITAEETQTYTRTVTNGNCSSTQTIDIQVVEVDVEINTTDISLCPDEEFDLLATGADNYTWSATGNFLSCGDCPNPTLAAKATGQIQVTGETAGCSESETINLTLSEAPSCNSIIASPGTSIPLGEMIQLNVDYDANTPVTIQWFLNGNTLGQGDSISTTINETENYIVAVISNNDGCTCLQEINIIGVKPILKLPNVFTPDGDGVNDFFDLLFVAEGTDLVVDRGNIEVVQFHVFNRWGNTVYQNENPTLGWDGMQNDKAAPSDVYVYFIEIKYPDGTSEIAKGDITLVR